MVSECIACKEEIKLNARKCPHCHQVQTKSANFFNTQIGSFITTGLLLCFFGWLVFGIISLIMNEELATQLEIDDGILSLNTGIEVSKISCFATIKNNSSVRWGDFSLQAEFFDQHGNIIDAHHEELESSVYPMFSFKARVSGNANASLEQYSTCRISIIDAEDY